MESSIWNIQLGDLIPASELCKQIELECQPELLALCSRIESYFTQHTVTEIDDRHVELVFMLFGKMVDELTHLFLKEKGLIYPGILAKGLQFVLQPAVIQQIQLTQEKITALLNRLRQLLNNFQMKPTWSAEWKNCVQDFFQVEVKIHQWIYVEQNLLYPHFIHSTNVN
jgi:iron-sulfur cluster repair protein YtfE (RIC family)